MNYALERIVKLEKERKYSFRLDREVMQLISTMVSQIGAPIVHTSSKKELDQQPSTQWKIVRKPESKLVTKTPKSKIVPDELIRKDDKAILSENIDEIRILLNKLTTKTYLETVEAMTKRLQSFQRYHRNGYLDKSILTKISETIFTIATQNQFYSKLYADLFSELVSQFDFLQSMFDSYAENVMEKFLDVGENVSEENYELFCKMNQTNDQRKSLAEFFVNLIKNNIISDATHKQYCVTMLKTVMTYVTEPDKKYQVEVLVDVLGILYDKGKISTVLFIHNDEEMKFSKCIKKFSKSKSTDFPSLSKKTIFKFMDMQGV